MVHHGRAGFQLPIGRDVENVVCRQLYILGLAIENASQRDLYLRFLRAALLLAVDIGFVAAEGIKTSAKRQQLEHGGVLKILKGKSSRPLHVSDHEYPFA